MMTENNTINTVETETTGLEVAETEELTGLEKAGVAVVFGTAIYGGVKLCEFAYKKAVKPAVNWVVNKWNNRKSKKDVAETEFVEIQEEK